MHSNRYYNLPHFTCKAAIFHVIKFQNRDFIFSFNFYNANYILLNESDYIAVILIIVLISTHKIVITIISNFFVIIVDLHSPSKSRIFEWLIILRFHCARNESKLIHERWHEPNGRYDFFSYSALKLNPQISFVYTQKTYICVYPPIYI